MRLKCSACETVYDDLLERAERDNVHVCTACGQLAAVRIMAVPYIRTSDSASYVDGTRRFSGVRETRALVKAKAKAKVDRNRDDEKRIAKEIKKIGSTK
jgi:NAD-dependent SIR2 family protein deacetylase